MGPQALRDLGLVAPWTSPVLGELKSGGPAERAGLRTGDLVTLVDGRVISDAQTLREMIRERAERPMSWTVDRSGSPVVVTVVPRAERSGGSTTGRIDAFVGTPPQTVLVSLGPVEGLIEGLRKTWEVSVLTVTMIGQMIIGEASIKNLSGPLTIADFAGQSAEKGWTSYIAFLALVSVSLGVLNLLPLPMLDGGHLMYYFFEWVTGRPVPDVWLEPWRYCDTVCLDVRGHLQRCGSACRFPLSLTRCFFPISWHRCALVQPWSPRFSPVPTCRPPAPWSPSRSRTSASKVFSAPTQVPCSLRCRSGWVTPTTRTKAPLR